ncbi:50S ribosomal protein L11 [Isobaculum melis]|uniref:Large ribosomal subunit protein uL11 n=1 Tax=Isobaculum melis TaxID=142588 RepID=A0A1H9QYL5_9LACT|nr:50S ribosomal protein L11 [Isobaculum melis]SER64793.1 LSU ribosomal protein L11P [Isobaculum melis]
MNKNSIRTIKLNLPAGKVTPATIGKDLAPTGIHLANFSQEYNERTKADIGKIIPAKITIYEDRSFKIEVTAPPTAFLIKEALGIQKGAAKTGHETVGTLTKKQVAEIANIKMPDLNVYTLESAMKMIEGTAKNMGVVIEK